PGEARVTEHMMLFEPTGSDLSVRESYLWQNSGKTTFNDPQGGTLRFQTPPGAKQLQVNATAPQGMPIRRAPEPAGAPNVYKVDFPIKPGETNITVDYTLPFTSPGSFAGKIWYKGGAPTTVVAPPGVTIKGEGLVSNGVEPRTQATILRTTGAAFKLSIEGSGTLRRAQQDAEPEPSGPQISMILPKIYDRMYWVLALSGTILVL